MASNVPQTKITGKDDEPSLMMLYASLSSYKRAYKEKYISNIIKQ